MLKQIINKLNSIQITKSHENCSACGLPIPTCICEELNEFKQQVNSNVHIDILFHEKELSRNTNTGRLIGLLNPDKVSAHIWNRTTPPENLLSIINNDQNRCYLLFPPDESQSTEDLEEKSNQESNQIIGSELSKTIHLIVIDGTWQEACKIVRKSSYLSEIQRLSVKSDKASIFTLRRNQKEGNLCTAEAIAEALKELEDHSMADILEKFTALYLERYEIGRSGHGLK